MLIIEGPDLVGKTTLAHKLMKRLNESFNMPHVYRHLSRLPNSFHRFWGYRALMSPYIVQDRFHMSEPIYAKMRGDETSLSPTLYSYVDASLRLQPAFIAVLYCEDEDLIKERWRENEMYGMEQVLQVNAFYKDMAYSEGVFYDYHMHYDCSIGLDKEVPFVNNSVISYFIDAYLQRLEMHQKLLKEKEQWMLAIS